MTDPRTDLMNSLGECQEKCKRVKDLVSKGIVSKRFGEYIMEMGFLDLLTREAEIYARLYGLEKATGSLAEMREHLDVIAGMYMSNLPPVRDKETGLLFVNMQDFPKSLEDGSFQDYLELYELAKRRCDSALEKVEQILGGPSRN